MKYLLTTLLVLFAVNVMAQTELTNEKRVISHAVEYLNTQAQINGNLSEIPFDWNKLKPVHFAPAFACNPDKLIENLQLEATQSKLGKLPKHGEFDIMCNGVGFVISVMVQQSE